MAKVRAQDLYDKMIDLEERMDTELLRNGKSETFWELQDRLDQIYEQLDRLEEVED